MPKIEFREVGIFCLSVFSGDVDLGYIVYFSQSKFVFTPSRDDELYITPDSLRQIADKLELLNSSESACDKNRQICNKFSSEKRQELAETGIKIIYEN